MSTYGNSPTSSATPCGFSPKRSRRSRVTRSTGILRLTAMRIISAMRPFSSTPEARSNLKTWRRRATSTSITGFRPVIHSFIGQSFPVPGGTFLAVLQHYPHLRQPVAHFIGELPELVDAQVLADLHQQVDKTIRDVSTFIRFFKRQA